jgi:hypothetical protein
LIAELLPDLDPEISRRFGTLEDARAQAAYGIHSAVNKILIINREIAPDESRWSSSAKSSGSRPAKNTEEENPPVMAPFSRSSQLAGDSHSLALVVLCAAFSRAQVR